MVLRDGYSLTRNSTSSTTRKVTKQPKTTRSSQWNSDKNPTKTRFINSSLAHIHLVKKTRAFQQKFVSRFPIYPHPTQFVIVSRNSKIINTSTGDELHDLEKLIPKRKSIKSHLTIVERFLDEIKNDSVTSTSKNIKNKFGEVN